MNGRKSRKNSLVPAIIVAAFFLTALVYFHGVAGAGNVYDFLVFPVVYIGIVVLLVDFQVNTPHRLRAFSWVVLGTVLILASTSVASSGHGYPLATSSTMFIQNCTTETYTNSTSIVFEYTETFTDCSLTGNGTVFSITNLSFDFLFWLPVSGLAVNALPVWRTEATGVRVSRGIIYVTLMAATLVPFLNILPLTPL